jgi:hypothetical protein
LILSKKSKKPWGCRIGGSRSNVPLSGHGDVVVKVGGVLNGTLLIRSCDGAKTSSRCPSSCTTYSRDQQTCRKARRPCLGQSKAQGDPSNLCMLHGSTRKGYRCLNIIRFAQGLAPEVVPSSFPENLSPADFENIHEYPVATATHKAVEVYERLVVRFSSTFSHSTFPPKVVFYFIFIFSVQTPRMDQIL